MRKKYVSKIAALTTAIIVASVSFSGCGKYNSSNVPGNATATEETQNFDGNTDITAGVVDDGGYYYCEASLGEAQIPVTVDSLGSSVKTSDFSNVSALADKSEKNLNDARVQYLMDAYAEDEETANEDLKELYSDPAPTDAQLAGIKVYSDDLAKVIAQFGITYYDFTAPYINNSEDSESIFFEYDFYTDDYRLFNVDVMLSGDEVTSIDIYEDYDVASSTTEAATEAAQ